MDPHGQEKIAKASKRLSAIDNRLNEIQRTVDRLEELVKVDSKKLSSLIERLVANEMSSSRRGGGAFNSLSFDSFDSDKRTDRRNARRTQGAEGAGEDGANPLNSPRDPPVTEPPKPRGPSKFGSAVKLLMGKRQSMLLAGTANAEGKPNAAAAADAKGGGSPRTNPLAAGDAANTALTAVASLAFVPERVPDADEAATLTTSASQTLNTSAIAARAAKPSRDATQRAAYEQSYDVDGPFMSLMDVFFIFTAVLTTIFTISVWNPLTEMDFDALPPMNLVWWLAAVYVHGAVWVTLRFFTRSRIGDWEVVDDLPSIRSQYLKSWFAFDVLYAAPIDLVFLGWANRGFYYLLLRHFLRYIRMLSLGRSVNPLLTHRMWFNFISFVGTMAVIAHALANVFWTLQTPNNGTLTYIQSIYWTTASLTSVGYGDFTATSDNGRAFSCFAMFTGTCMLATFSAFATAYILDKEPVQVELEARKAMMHSMLKYYDIPWEMQREVIQLMPAALNKSTEAHMREELDLLPTFVQEKLVHYFNAHQLRELPLFSEARLGTVVELSKKMKKVFVPRYDFIFHEGDAAQEMYFISRGHVDLLVQGKDDYELVQALREGKWFGEEIFRTNDEPRRAVSAQATANCELISFDKESLADFIAMEATAKESMLLEYRTRKLAISKVKKLIAKAEASNNGGEGDGGALLDVGDSNHATLDESEEEDESNREAQEMGELGI